MNPRRIIKRVLVTGGAGFMGSSFVRYLLQKVSGIEKVVTLDLLTYAGNLDHLKEILSDPRHHFERGDINNSPLVESLLRIHSIDAIIHFAAESHVDRSIENPRLFYRSNVEGTVSLLEVVRRFPHVHFHQISTDEVFGSIAEGSFVESSPYRPNSPYAASKAAADHFVRAYASTYQLSVTLSHASNNFGPCQYVEKFIPLMITNTLQKKPLPVYGDGNHMREWLYVEDHARAVWTIVENGVSSESYNIGGGEERKNIDLLYGLIEAVAQMQKEPVSSLRNLIQFVGDRPGHDFRYALNHEKISHHLGWKPTFSFEEKLKETVEWYAKR